MMLDYSSIHEEEEQKSKKKYCPKNDTKMLVKKMRKKNQHNVKFDGTRIEIYIHQNIVSLYQLHVIK